MSRRVTICSFLTWPSSYGVHPSVAMMQAWITGLHQKTGRTFPGRKPSRAEFNEMKGLFPNSGHRARISLEDLVDVRTKGWNGRIMVPARSVVSRTVMRSGDGVLSHGGRPECGRLDR